MLRQATPKDSSPIADVYWASRQSFLPYAPLKHSFPDVKRWVADTLLVTHTVWVDELEGRITGFVASAIRDNVGWIDQIYVLPGMTGNGTGARLLDQALTRLPRPVRLYTFQANEGSRKFYERYGFTAVRLGDGSNNEERCPDVLYELG